MIRRLFTLLAAAAVSAGAFAPAAPAREVTISTVPVAEGIFMLTGQGGNIGLFVGDDGTFLIDDQYAPLTKKILAAIEAAGGTLPKFLLNTHYHGDHTGGNENFGGKGVLIVSHDNVRERLLSGSYLAAFETRRGPVPAPGLPMVTFSEGLSFHLNGDTLHAVHIPHAHTDGDSFIHFRSANVIHAGDIFFNGFFPFVDVAHGGSLQGMIAGADRLLALADAETKIIPGHGPLAGRAELAAYRRMLATAYQRLNHLKREGKSVQQAMAAEPLADLEAEWGDGMFTAQRWIELVYPGVY